MRPSGQRPTPANVQDFTSPVTDQVKSASESCTRYKYAYIEIHIRDAHFHLHTGANTHRVGQMCLTHLQSKCVCDIIIRRTDRLKCPDSTVTTNGPQRHPFHRRLTHLRHEYCCSNSYIANVLTRTSSLLLLLHLVQHCPDSRQKSSCF